LAFFQAGIINHDGHDFDANMTSVPDQEAQLALPDGEIIGEVRSCSQTSVTQMFMYALSGGDLRPIL